MPEFQIRRNDLREARFVEAEPGPLAEGAARLKVELFSLTANNVTYAAMGTGPLGYWDFFPAPEGWGRVPVWGFATVAASNAAGVAEGARVYGYLPIAATFDVVPARVTGQAFLDASAHRQGKATVYNQYVFTAGDPAYDAAFEPEQTLFRPLYATGWWAADCVAAGTPAPAAAVLSSASSKTALASAAGLKRHGVTRIGLTGAGNAGYVRGTGLYDRVLTYDEIAGLGEVAGPAAFLDFLGRPALTAAVHGALGDALVRSLIIGATDWSADRPPGGALPGPAPEFFFVPDYAAKRLRDEPQLLGALTADLRAFYPASRALVAPVVARGPDAVAAAWRDLVEGKAAPDRGLVFGL